MPSPTAPPQFCLFATGTAAPAHAADTVKPQRQASRGAWGAPGMIVAVALMLVSLLTILATGLISVAYREARIGTAEQTYVQALYNADAGLEEAKMRLSPAAPAANRITPVANTAWRAYILSGHTQTEIQNGLDPTYGKAADGSSESTASYSFVNTVQGNNGIQWGWARIQHKVNAGNIVYLNAVNGNETTAPSQTVNGNTVNNFPVYSVTVRGVSGQAQREIHMELQPIIQTTTTETQDTTTYVTNPFGEAAHGVQGVTLGPGSVTDSYKSSWGAYNSSTDAHGLNKRSNGNIGTDGTSANIVDNKGTVNGNAVLGPGDLNPDAVNNHGGLGSITGTQTQEADAWNIPLSTIPTGVTNSGAFSVSGNDTKTLTTGTYWFSSLSITGNGKINVTGSVKIYVTGPIDIGGNGIVNATEGKIPSNVLIYGTVDPTNSNNMCTSVSVHGNGNFYGAIYAPAADITVDGNSGAAIYGAVTGKTVTLNNGKLHWDEDLMNLGATTSVVVTTTNTTTYSITGTKRYLWNESLL